jgi:uncharacterized Fe-S center protein
MQNVYFKTIASYAQTGRIQNGARELLEMVIERERLQLEPYVPLKVHFGEKGNQTFIEPKNFEGIIAYLQAHNVGSAFMETNALYSGSRMTRTQHLQLAKAHGFTQLPIIIADGEYGEDYTTVEINQKHFKTCKIGKEIANQRQMIVLSHFKGHRLAGFGGAIKQLAMGCAARGGKLDQHADAEPLINPFRCKKCQACFRHCPVDAIYIGLIPRIDKKKCIGCAGCMAVCPQKAILFNILKSLSNTFPEKLIEYAFAAQKDQTNIYITFAFKITKGCDCEGHQMKPLVGDLGLFAATDPVAIDQACLDMLDQREGKRIFGHARQQLDYAQKIGLGSKNYELIEMK